jgi:hypothetical protein
MGSHILAIDLLLSDTILVDTECGQDGSRSRIDLSSTVADDAHYDFLPRVLAPRLAVGPRVHVLDVLDDANHGARKQLVLLVVHGDDDEQLSVPRLGKQLLAQREALGIKFARIAGGGGVAHVGELVTLGRLCMGDLVEQPRWDGAVEHQVALEQLHLLDRLPALDRGRHDCRRKQVVVKGVVGVVLQVVLVGFVWIWAIRVCAVDHGPPRVFVLPVVVWLRAVCMLRALVVGRRLVGLVVVGIVVRVGIQRVVAVVTNASGARIVVVVVVARSVGNVLYRVLP